MERSTSIYGSSSALRGVQLKIGESFKPPGKVTLPVGWKTRDPSRLLSLSYDFSLEEEVIKKVKIEREAKQQQEQAQKMKEFVKTSTVANPVVANMGSDILQPTTVTTKNRLNSNNENEQFNYKDFEDNTDTPFESVELQSINNMEALKSVLQPKVENNSAASSTTQSQIPQRVNNPRGIPIKQDSIQCDPQVSPNSLETSFPRSGSPVEVSNANQYPPPYPDELIQTQSDQIRQNSNPFAAQNSLIMEAQGPSSAGLVSMSPQSNNVSYSAENTNRRISHPGAVRVLPISPARPPPRRPGSVPNETTTTEMMSDIPNHVAPQSTTPGQKRPIPKPRSKLPPLRSGPETSTHVPPLRGGPEITTHVPPSNIPPPLPPKKIIGKNRIKQHAQKPAVLVDDPNLKRYPSPLPPISPPMQDHAPPLPTNDPRSTMSPKEVEFVNKISIMGFPVVRVARAVKNLGCKEREVVDFLVSVEGMCNLGYSEDQVEMVLKDNSDQSKAVEFLKLIVQFKELGFQEDKIYEALKKSECDSNKALDILTCAG